MFAGSGVKTTDQLGTMTSINTAMDESPPIWITHRTGTYHDDIYVNNARLLLSQSNIRGKYMDKEQVGTIITHSSNSRTV